MKINSITLALGALPLLAAAQPHRVRHAHQNKHVKKAVVTVIDTIYAEPTRAPDVLVYVDQFGEPLSTITEGLVETVPTVWSTAFGAAPTPAPSSSSSSSTPPPPAPSTTSSAYVAPAPVLSSSSSTPVVVENVQTSTPAAVAEVASSTAAVIAPVVSAVSSAIAPAQTTASSSSSEGSGFGLSYSPYNSDNSCKTQDQVNKDFETIGSGYSRVRTYGTNCNQTATVLSAAKNYGMKIFAGIYDITAIQDEANLIIAAANGDWSRFDTVSVGNELVNSGGATAAEVVTAIGTARTLLKAAGFTGSVVTVDTLVAARANPSICDASDYCAVNCHPFFDGNVVAKDAGDFLTTQIPTLRNVLSNKNQEIVITETGWPSQGKSNNVAVPGLTNQQDAISSIKSSFTSNPESIILFTAFNDMWKTNTAEQYEAEQYWGFLGSCPSG